MTDTGPDGMELLPDHYRRATPEETEEWLAGYVEIPGAVETPEGLLVPDQTCHCGESIPYHNDEEDEHRNEKYGLRWKHRRCHLIP